jgi:hypothetical protein
MKYSVYWRDSALAQVRVRAFLDLEMDVHHNTVEQAVEVIDRHLSSTPDSSGESRTDSERVLIVPPLSVHYEVFDEQQVVLIYHVKYRNG